MSTKFLERIVVPCGSAAIACAMAVALMAPVPAEAATIAELQAQASATLDKLEALQDKLDQASTDYYEALDAQEAAKQKKEEATSQIQDLQGKLSTRARGMYMNGALSMLDVLTSSASFQEFTNNWDILNNMNQSDAEMIGQVKEYRKVEEEQERIESENAAKAEQTKNEAETLVSECEALLSDQTEELANAIEAERQARNAANLSIVQAAMANGGGYTGGGSGYSGNVNYYNGNASYIAGDVIANAKAMLGSSYVWGGASPSGFDCSGFVGWCISGGRQGTDAYYGSWPQTNNPQPGDVCWRDGHVGIYIGDGQMIHASDYGTGVIQSAVEPGMTYHRK
ncbi:MAG: hydrolase Nlp/P60 [Eggerthellaceae bacterium]|nr:hydrolase Nlp/P60 [Eggerthellaceae bacterium]